MISILIPTYNYSVVKLVNKLHEQASKFNVLFEIIVIDDCSNDELILAKNRSIQNLEFCKLIENKSNIGRTASRDYLAHKANYNWLLFMDADVMPKHNNFLDVFLLKAEGYDLIFGGISYKNEIPSRAEIFRWKYGKSRESLPLNQRLKHPYQSINSGCFLVKKEMFLIINNELDTQKYGMDILFKQVLFNHKINVLHIDNPVYHLGLESSRTFLKKSLEAIETIVFLEKNNSLNTNISLLQKSYLRLNKMKLLRLFHWIIKRFKNNFENNFNSKNPNLFFFDLYRLYYYIELKTKENA